MANVVDVVTELSYNADVTPIEHVNAAFGEQQKMIQGLMRENMALEQQKKRMAQAGITDQTKINALIQQNTKRIDEATAAMGKQLATSEKLQTSVKRSKQQFDSLSFSIGNLLRDAPYGFIGIANNIGPAFDDLQRKMKSLQAEGKPTSAIFSSIGASLFGFTGLVNLAVLGISTLSSSLGGVTAATADLTNAQEANIAVSGEAAKLYAKEAAELGLLADEVADVTTSQDRLHQIREELITQAPALAKMLEGEENLSARLFNAVNLLTEAYKQQAIAKAALALITKETERFLSNEIKDFDAFGVGARNSLVMAFQGTAAFLQSAAADAAKVNQKQYESTIKNLAGIYKQAKEALDISGLGASIAKPEKALKTSPINKATKSVEELRKEIDELARAINRLDNGEFEKFGNELEKKAKDIAKSIQESLGSIGDNFTLQLQDEYDSPLSTNESDTLNAQLEIYEAQKKLREKNEAEEKATAEKRKERIVEGVSQANDLIQQVGGILNQIYDAQLNKIDQQITTTNENISKAYELARMGNATYLKEEEDRLATLQKKREETAQKQLQLNAVLMASQQALNLTEAIGAIVSAAAKGDPYTIALRIAAAVAALIGGVAAIQGAFAEGVVDFQGKGTGKSDSNVVRISKGESVITAEATQKYKPMLAAMNAGTFTAMPVSTQGVSRYEMDGVHARLDTVIDVLSQSKTAVNFNATPDGIAIMTQTAIRRNQNRFRG